MSLVPGGWEPPDAARGRLLGAYYDRLNEYAPFAEALGELFRQLDALGPEPLPPPPRVAGRGGLPPALPGAVRAELERFVARWPLPPDAPLDVWFSYWQWVAAARRGRPRLLPRPLWVGVPVAPEEPMALPLRVSWNPVLAGPAAFARAVQALARALAEALHRLAEVKERRLRAAGWRPTPPHERRAETIDRRARWLFRRLVLRMTYDAIADAESEQTGEPVSADTVRKSVARDTRLLGRRRS